MTILEAFLYPLVVLSGLAIGIFFVLFAVGTSLELVDKVSGRIK
jgi:hypothetical protein